MTPPAAGAVAGYTVELPQFEGPLDLLLHLIQRHELDIFDIPVAFVTERYLAYISVMQTLNLDVAAEYLLMAATLAHIKSRMLLPTPPPDDPEADDLAGTDGADPREALVKRLLEYQKFRDAAENLAARDLAGRDVFARGGTVDSGAPEASALADLPLFAMLEAFERVLRRGKLKVSHEVTTERVSIAERITEIVDALRGPRTARFDALFDGDQSVADLVVTFLAVLEMTRLRMTRLFQSGPTAPLHITLVLVEIDPGTVQEDFR